MSLLQTSKKKFLLGLLPKLRWPREFSLWFSFRKGTITASKPHEVMTNKKKVVSGGGGVVNLQSSFQKV